jgi:hypothetical protein
METGDLVQAVVWFTVKVNGNDFLIEKGEQLVVLGVEKMTLKKQTMPNYIYMSIVLTRFGIAHVALSTIMAQTFKVK